MPAWTCLGQTLVARVWFKHPAELILGICHELTQASIRHRLGQPTRSQEHEDKDPNTEEGNVQSHPACVNLRKTSRLKPPGSCAPRNKRSSDRRCEQFMFYGFSLTI